MGMGTIAPSRGEYERIVTAGVLEDPSHQKQKCITFVALEDSAHTKISTQRIPEINPNCRSLRAPEGCRILQVSATTVLFDWPHYNVLLSCSMEKLHTRRQVKLTNPISADLMNRGYVPPRPNAGFPYCTLPSLLTRSPSSSPTAPLPIPSPPASLPAVAAPAA